jgi:hypothetical protein
MEREKNKRRLLERQDDKEYERVHEVGALERNKEAPRQAREETEREQQWGER